MIIRQPVIETTSKTPVLCGAGGKVLKEPVLNLPPDVARTPSLRSDSDLPAWNKSTDPFCPPDPKNSTEYWNPRWEGQRDKYSQLTGKYSRQDMLENFFTAFEDDSWQGYYRASNYWLIDLFRSGEEERWAKNVLDNCYFKVFGEYPADVHIILVRDAIVVELHRLTIERRLEDTRYREHKLWGTWVNMLPKVARKVHAYRTGNLAAIHPNWRRTYQSYMDDVNLRMQGRNEIMATKKAAKKSKAKKSTAKKTATKKAVKNKKAADRGESWTDSIIASCGRLKGARRYREIAEKVEARRIELGLLAKDHSNIALTQKLKSMAKNGSVTIVAPGQYSFDGSKKRLASATTTKKSAPKKTAKKGTAVKRNPVG